MGWTGYVATHTYKDGQINRKKECDAYFTDGLNQGFCRIEKSVMKGSEYYAAITDLKREMKDSDGNVIKDTNGNVLYENIPKEEQKTFAVVFRTAVQGKMFYYKPMPESVGPCYYGCPNTILDLLSPTDSEFANEWRMRCRNLNAKPSLSKLPIGTKIKYMSKGEEIILEKRRPAYQFKSPWWYHQKSGGYAKKKDIPKDFEIVDEEK